ncbi:MAG TPA: hypothetical protein VGL32_11780 [Acidimicrobiales bacterium]
MVLAETALHVRGLMGKVLLAAAAYLVAMALLSRGPLGLVHIVGPRLHQALDLVLVVGLAVSPVIARDDLDVAGVIVAEALAIVLLRLAFRTRYLPAAATLRRVNAAAAQAGEVAGEPGRPSVSEEGGGAEPRAGAANAPAARPSPEQAEGGDAAPLPAAEPPATQRPVPTTAWTLGVLAARARRRGAGPDRALGEGARRIGAALGRANRRRTD